MKMALLVVLFIARASYGAEESASKSPAPEKCIAPPSPETLAQLNKMLPDLASKNVAIHQKAFDGITRLGHQVLGELHVAVQATKDEHFRHQIQAVIKSIESIRKNW